MIQHPLLLALSFSMQLQSTTLQPDASISGKVSASDPTAARSQIGFVIVDVTGPSGLQEQVSGDSAGSYTVAELSEGVYTLRFERTGYIPLTLDVRVAAHSSVHLDVTLDRAPPMMQTIKVLARDGLPRIPARPNSVSAYRPWRIDGNSMQSLPSLDFPEVIRTVATSPYAQISPESGGGMHLQGGATDHTLLVLDGIPLYNAIHAGDHPSALDPDAVTAMSVYAEPRARDGGRLAGVVEVSTRAA
ncbi:MAG TPA: carboxypeptidase-like regulatory domain-containing protein, partial [Gemmatimonadaceae bacterium]|nr:carboxypeptidase-like regulatory domain-containing protein [Gemmatimonadaceae bacterium]